MKNPIKNIIKSLVVTLVLGFIVFYITLPAINIHAMEFYIFLLFIYVVFFASLFFTELKEILSMKNVTKIEFGKAGKIIVGVIPLVFVLIILINLIESPLFNSKKYATRIDVGTGKDFATEVKEVDLEEKATQLSQKYFPDEENIWARANIEARRCKSACIEMAEWLKAQKGELL